MLLTRARASSRGDESAPMSKKKSWFSTLSVSVVKEVAAQNAPSSAAVDAAASRLPSSSSTASSSTAHTLTRLSLDEIMQRPAFVSSFRSFLAGKYCAETIDFLMACQRFRVSNRSRSSSFSSSSSLSLCESRVTRVASRSLPAQSPTSSPDPLPSRWSSSFSASSPSLLLTPSQSPTYQSLGFLSSLDATLSSTSSSEVLSSPSSSSSSSSQSSSSSLSSLLSSSATSMTNLPRTGGEIYQSFISNSGAQSVNISSSCRDRVQQQVEGAIALSTSGTSMSDVVLGPEVFNEACKEIAHLLEREWLAKWFDTPQYALLMQWCQPPPQSSKKSHRASGGAAETSASSPPAASSSTSSSSERRTHRQSRRHLISAQMPVAVAAASDDILSQGAKDSERLPLAERRSALERPALRVRAEPSISPLRLDTSISLSSPSKSSSSPCLPFTQSSSRRSPSSASSVNSSPVSMSTPLFHVHDENDSTPSKSDTLLPSNSPAADIVSIESLRRSHRKHHSLDANASPIFVSSSSTSDPAAASSPSSSSSPSRRVNPRPIITTTSSPASNTQNHSLVFHVRTRTARSQDPIVSPASQPMSTHFVTESPLTASSSPPSVLRAPNMHYASTARSPMPVFTELHFKPNSSFSDSSDSDEDLGMRLQDPLGNRTLAQGSDVSTPAHSFDLSHRKHQHVSKSHPVKRSLDRELLDVSQVSEIKGD